MLSDRYGNAVSTKSQAALDRFNDALELVRLYRGDPIAALDAAIAEDGAFVNAWAVRAGVLAQQTDKLYADEVERSLRAGAAAAEHANERERGLLAAALDFHEGRYHDGVVRYARIAHEHPRDVFAVQSAHVGCFFVGRQQDLRDGPLQALRAFKRGEDGYGVLLGMAAFGFEECGDYTRAEAYGREAVEIDGRDGWAVHAVAHVHEMRGDVDRGIPWLRDSAGVWAPESAFAYHNWWHLALLHLDRGEIAEVLRLYDEKVRPAPSDVMLEWVDAAALLWRLRLEGVDVATRFAPLAESMARAAEDGVYAFNDLHCVMAFIGAGREGDVARTLEAMRKTARIGDGDNAEMTRAVGLPLAEAFVAFEAGRFGECVEKIAAVRGIAQRFGGSHAQRDILTLTALHAAIRGGMEATAEALAAERLTHKPTSPWAASFAAKVAAMRGTRVAA
ncbi:MAG: tetratricopeptide repeat protein [Hydrogenophilaceae bacterium]|jgi:tetratricopeptide (TPR) repeat protein|nr:tetratricopeptide repeat protein [Hydrogenophilaceae bacterium]